MSKTAIENKNKISLFFDYDPDLINEVRNLLGRKYVPEHKYWTCSLCLANIQSIMDLEFTLDDSLERMYYKLTKLKENTKDIIIEDLDTSKIKVPQGLELMPFQLHGVAFIESRKGNVIIGDEMGLGKTITALTYISNHPELTPVIIVVPASLKYNWKNEAEKWLLTNRNMQILSGRKTEVLNKKTTDIVILNYDIASYWVKELQKIKAQVIILDEAHFIKNRKSKRTKAILQLARKIKHKLPLSGTPAINKPIELYEAINMVEPDLFASYHEFGIEYCNGYFNGFGWDFSGSSKLPELYNILKNIMLRRKKADVLKDLPDKRFSYVPFELINAKEYYRAENDFKSEINDDGKEQGLSACNAEMLFQLAVKGALPYSIDWISQFLESGEEKLVVFATHRFVIDALMNEFKDIAVKIDGSVSTGEIRSQIVDKFQNDDSIRLFVGNIKAAGVGLTLTAASNVAFLELPWTPAELTQAIDRCHRIGQKNAVNVWFLLADNTIEMRLAKILDKKQNVLSQAIDGQIILEQNTLTAIMQSYRN